MTKAAEFSRQGLVAVVASVIACAICQGISRPPTIRAQSEPPPVGSPFDAQVDARAPLPPRVARVAPAAEGKAETPSIPRPSAILKASAAFEGEPLPGLRVRLTCDGTSPEGHVRWIQVRGPEATLDDPTSRTPSLVVPRGEGSMEFVLIVSDEAETASCRLNVPIWAARAEPEVVRASDTGPVESLKADAGDDQIGIAGRQITLNGGRCEPRTGVGFRWIQVAGPRVRLALDEGPVYSFVPQAPGVYQFALLIAKGSRISEPDTVTVSVGNPSSPYGPEADAPPPEVLHEAARSSVGAVPGGLDVAEDLGEVFDGLADRMDLYRSYTECFHELGLRLERLVPTDAARRAVWDERLFVPLTARLIEGLKPEGLDLRQAEARNVVLTASQRAKLAEMFRAMARGFRSARPAPGPAASRTVAPRR